MKPQELSNEDLIEMCQIALLNFESPHLTELITRFERITLGNKADEAIQKMEELQEPTLQVGWEYHNGRGEWVQIVDFINGEPHPYKEAYGSHYNPSGQWTIDHKSDRDLILSTGRPVKKVQIDDEVEALAREIFVNIPEITSSKSFKAAEEFIKYRNERRAGNGK